jgi:hypothetical protein
VERDKDGQSASEPPIERALCSATVGIHFGLTTSIPDLHAGPFTIHARGKPTKLRQSVSSPPREVCYRTTRLPDNLRKERAKVRSSLQADLAL